MESNGRMMGLKQEDQEIELDLGLSIDGGFKKSEKPNSIQVKHEPAQLQCTSNRKASSFGADLRKRKTRQDEQEKKGMCMNGGFDDVVQENKMWLKSPKLETNEPKFDAGERGCKRSRLERCGFGNNNVEMKNVNLNFTIEQNMIMNRDFAFSRNDPTLCSMSSVCPVMYPFVPVQLVRFPNGIPYPCVNVVPFWANGGVGVGNERNVVQSLVNQRFKPFQTGYGSRCNVDNGCASGQDSRRQESIVLPVCSSSIASDYRSSSHEGGGSSDTRSHSIHSQPEHANSLRRSKGNDTKGQSEHSASSHLKENAQIHDETTNSIKPTTTTSNHPQCSPSTSFTTNCIKQKIPSKGVQFCPIKPKEEAATNPGPVYENPVSWTENPSPGPLKESKRGIGKPPKPQTQNQNVASFPQMPCVSTTGNGPNGKTINGFLYKYSKTEVSIICVCHGTSFSPAEFVQHAGSIDVSHPLRHITVLPSAF